MPRTLPWLTDVSRVKKEKPRESTPRGGRIKPDTPRRDGGAESKQTPIDATDKRDFFRSSQTPPTSPIQQCPSEEFLIEGLDNDDIYIMVEDEFYAVAQTFTQHLHYAEYVRRTKEAKAQNATAIRDLERPTDDRTPMSDALRRKKASEVLRSRQNTGLEEMVGKRPRADSSSDAAGEDTKDNEDDNNEEEMWSGTHLYDLMTSPRKARALVGLQGIRSSTRAAAGYAQSAKAKHQTQVVNRSGQMTGGSPSPVRRRSHEEFDQEALTTSDEDGDLDARPSPAIGRPVQVIRKPPCHEGLINRQPSTPKATRIEAKKGRENGISSTDNKYSTSVRSRPPRLLLLDDFDPLPGDMDMKKQHSTPDLKHSNRRRPSQNAPRVKESETKKSRLNEVPTFLV